MEPRIQNGDYIPDGLGGVVRSQGADALLERVLFRLTARRGGLPPLPQLGSRLYLLGREPAAQRLSAARQYVAEALAQIRGPSQEELLKTVWDNSLRLYRMEQA